MTLSPKSDTKPLLDKVVVQNDEFSPIGESPLTNSSPSDIDNKYHLDDIIPQTHSHRTIILCFDGTGDQFSEDVRTTYYLYLKGITPADFVKRTPISFSSSPC